MRADLAIAEPPRHAARARVVDESPGRSRLRAERVEREAEDRAAHLCPVSLLLIRLAEPASRDDALLAAAVDALRPDRLPVEEDDEVEVELVAAQLFEVL